MNEARVRVLGALLDLSDAAAVVAFVPVSTSVGDRATDVAVLGPPAVAASLSARAAQPIPSFAGATLRETTSFVEKSPGEGLLPDHHELSMVLVDRERVVGWVGAVRERPFAPSARRRVVAATAPWVRALLRSARSAAPWALDESAWVVVGERGGVQHATPAAEPWLADAGGEAALAGAIGAPPGEVVVHGGVELTVTPLMPVAYLVQLRPVAPVTLAARASLSPMQRAVAERAATGATVREIASTVDAGTETVRSHLREAYRRLGVSNRVELVRALSVG